MGITFFVRPTYVTRFDTRGSFVGRDESVFVLRTSNAPRYGNVKISDKSRRTSDDAPGTDRSTSLIVSVTAAYTRKVRIVLCCQAMDIPVLASNRRYRVCNSMSSDMSEHLQRSSVINRPWNPLPVRLAFEDSHHARELLDLPLMSLFLPAQSSSGPNHIYKGQQTLLFKWQ